MNLDKTIEQLQVLYIASLTVEVVLKAIFRVVEGLEVTHKEKKKTRKAIGIAMMATKNAQNVTGNVMMYSYLIAELKSSSYQPNYENIPILDFDTDKDETWQNVIHRTDRLIELR